MFTTYSRLHVAAILLLLLNGCNKRHGVVLSADANDPTLSDEFLQLPNVLDNEDKDLSERIKHWKPKEIRKFIQEHMRRGGEPLRDPYIVRQLLSISHEEYSKRRSSKSARGDQIEKFRQRVNNVQVQLRKQEKGRITPMDAEEPSSSSSPPAAPAIALGQGDTPPTVLTNSRKRQRTNQPSSSEARPSVAPVEALRADMQQTRISTQQALATQQQQLKKFQQDLKALSEKVALHSTYIASAAKGAYEKAVEKYQKKLLAFIQADIKRGNMQQAAAQSSLQKGNSCWHSQNYPAAVNAYQDALLEYQSANGYFNKALGNIEDLENEDLAKNLKGSINHYKAAVEAMINQFKGFLQPISPQPLIQVSRLPVTLSNTTKS